MSCTCDHGYGKSSNGVRCEKRHMSSRAAVGRGRCQNSGNFVYSSKTYGKVTCGSIDPHSWSMQECSPSSQYGFFEKCPVSCSSLCAIDDVTHVTASKFQHFVGGKMHGINSWFTFEAKAGVTYRIESHNEGKMYLFDAKLMSAVVYSPHKAMLGGTEHSRLYSNVSDICMLWHSFSLARVTICTIGTAGPLPTSHLDLRSNRKIRCSNRPVTV